MKKLILAAAFMVAATPVAFAQFNPGTVVGNVYQNPAAGYGYGYAYGFGLPYPPPADSYAVRQKSPGHRTGNGAGLER